MLAKPVPKKEISTTPETLYLVTMVYGYEISVGRCLKIKTMLVRVKEYMSKNFATCNSLCNLEELYTAFIEKHPNINNVFSNFCSLISKWCVLAGSKMVHCACICGAHQNVVLLVDAMDWNLTYKDLIKLTLPCRKYFH